MSSQADNEPSEIDNKARDHALLIAKLCDEKRAEDILVLDVDGVCNYADYFVLATVSSQPQMRGITKDTEKILKSEGLTQLSRRGLDTGNWVLLDYGDLIIHIFDPEMREFYRLENIWKGAKEVPFE